MAEKFVVVGGWGGEHLTTVSNSKASCFRFALSWVALGFDKNIIINQGFWTDFNPILLELAFVGSTYFLPGQIRYISLHFELFFLMDF